MTNGSVRPAGLPPDALLVLDSAPIIYYLEDHPEYGARFAPLFDMHSQALVRLAVSTATIAEVLTGPSAAGDEMAVDRYRSIFESWQVIALDSAIAASAARIRGSLRLKLFDAVQVASALAIKADALVTHDRFLEGHGLTGHLMTRRPQYSLEEYLRVEEMSNVRHEFLDGEIFGMAGGTPEHGRIAANIIMLLGMRTSQRRCAVFTSDVRVRVAATASTRIPM